MGDEQRQRQQQRRDHRCGVARIGRAGRRRSGVRDVDDADRQYDKTGELSRQGLWVDVKV